MNPYSRRFTRLAGFLMLAKDGGESGGSLTLEEQLTAARNDLSTAKGEVTSLTAERDNARTDLTSAQAEVTRLTNQFSELTTTANATKSELDTAKTTITSLTAERDQAKNGLTLATANVTRLEQLCGVKGIDPNSAIPAAAEGAARKKTVAEFNTKLAAAKTPAERNAVLKAFGEAAQAGQVAAES